MTDQDYPDDLPYCGACGDSIEDTDGRFCLPHRHYASLNFATNFGLRETPTDPYTI